MRQDRRAFALLKCSLVNHQLLLGSVSNFTPFTFKLQFPWAFIFKAPTIHLTKLSIKLCYLIILIIRAHFPSGGYGLSSIL